MRYLYLLLSVITVCLIGLWSVWFVPSLVHDLRLRNQTLYVAKEYEVVRGGCSSLASLSLCWLTVQHQHETSISKQFNYFIPGNFRNTQIKVLKTRSQILTLNLGRSQIKNRLVAFFSAIGVFILAALLFFFIYRYKSSGKRRAAANEYSEEYLLKLAKTVRVPDNPAQVWKNILRESNLRWVVFRSGTLVLCEDERAPYEHTAWRVIDQYAHPVHGSNLGDYSIYLNADNAVWVISYPDSSVFNYIKVSECTLEAVAGMVARERRAQDAYEKQILHIEQGYY